MAKLEIYTEFRAERLSIGQAIAGALCVMLNIVAISAGATFSVVCHGLWGGIAFIIAGTFGVISVKNNTRCLTMTTMVLNIVAACTTIPVMVFSALGAREDEGIKCILNELIILIALGELAMSVFASVVFGEPACRPGKPKEAED